MILSDNINYSNFKAFLAKNNINHKDVAKFLEISPPSFSRKITRFNNAKFTQEEILKLSKHYNLCIDEYFFST